MRFVPVCSGSNDYSILSYLLENYFQVWLPRPISSQLIAGLADLLACALSMASGEYASNSSQWTQKRSLLTLRPTLRVDPDGVATDIRQFCLDRGVPVDGCKNRD